MPEPPSVAGEAKLDSRISLQKLEILCLVVELGTVTATAEHLLVGQPVITAHLRSLEERLGVTLFVRKGRKLQLTEAGERVYAWAASVLARGRAMMREVEYLDDGLRGAALLGASMSIGSYRLPRILTAFRRARPQANLTMVVGEPESSMQRVEAGELDFCVVVLEAAPQGSVLEADLVGHEEVVLVASPAGEPQATEIDIADLARIPIIGSPRGSVRRTLVDRALGRLNAPAYRPVIEFGHPEAMKRAAIERLGATLLFRSAVESELATGSLRQVRLRDAQLSIPIYTIKREDKQLSALQSQLLATIRRELASEAARLTDHELDPAQEREPDEPT